VKAAFYHSGQDLVQGNFVKNYCAFEIFPYHLLTIIAMTIYYSLDSFKLIANDTINAKKGLIE